MIFLSVAFICGLLFAFGLGLAGMTQPHKVIGFLDFWGSWDPTLLFVMGGAIAVHLISYQLIKRRSSPFLASSFVLPQSKHVDAPLLTGAALFGVGWGIAGYCPGPALASLWTGRGDILVFVLSMTLGLLIHDFFKPKK